MATRLSDNRTAMAITVEQADELFREIAILTHKRDKIKADFEKRIANLKKQADDYLAAVEANITTAADTLCAYIDAHRERFVKPRQHVTEFGKYGLRTVANLEIQDREAALAAVKALKIPAVIVTEKLDNKALVKALSDGAEISGVEIRRGEIASYTVTKELGKKDE